MQFLLLIYHAEAEWNKLTPADMAAMHKDYFNFTHGKSKIVATTSAAIR
jgi:hypothetical protein